MFGNLACFARWHGRLAAAGLAFALAACSTITAQENPSVFVDDEEFVDTESRSRIDPNEIRRGIAMGGERGKSREQIYFEREIAKVEPDLKGKPENLDMYIELFKSNMVNDLRIFAFDADAEYVDGTVRLTGYSEYPEIHETFIKLFEYLGFEKIDDQMEMLPSESLGEKRFALVTSGYAFSYAGPTEPRERVTQDFVGDPVYLLMKKDGHYLTHTAEGYVGFISEEHLYPVTAEEFGAYLDGARAAFQKPHQVGELLIPAGSRLKYIGREGSMVQVQLPGGEVIDVPGAIIEIRSDEPSEVLTDAIAVAHELIGSDYVWGGKSVAGVDCSGLVQSSFRSQGINLPRDAYQQAYIGTISGTRWYQDSMKPGDTLYFLGRRGKIHHTAIYLGDSKFIEATGPVVRVSSLRPGEEGYSERRTNSFCFAKRIVE